MEKTKIYKGGVQYEVDPTSLPAATPQAPGAVKKGASVAKITNLSNVKTALTANAILSSLRNSGVIGNDKFVVLYEPNYTEDLDEDWYYDIYDDVVYTAGQTATVKWEFGDSHRPYRNGYKFIGWALTPNAQTPDYPYDESDPQTYTLTFVDSDITLYAVWQMRIVTLTYSLGEYGQGSVPAAQTVQEGEGIIISFSPAPTVNDGSGRVFVGWAYDDGENSYNNAAYTADNAGETVYIYDDTTLYPVFVAQHILTYALGNDATGTVPSSQTAYDGEIISINFNPSVTCISDNTKVFVGWSTTDESSYADYTPSGTNEIYMNSDVTLYPVFAAQGGGGPVLTINNTNGEHDVVVYHLDEDSGDGVIDFTVTAGTADIFTPTEGVDYFIKYQAGEGNNVTSLFTGSYGGTGYNNEELSSDATYGNAQIFNPPAEETVWAFTSGDYGTLIVNQSNS